MGESVERQVSGPPGAVGAVSEVSLGVVNCSRRLVGPTLGVKPPVGAVTR